MFSLVLSLTAQFIFEKYREDFDRYGGLLVLNLVAILFRRDTERFLFSFSSGVRFFFMCY